MTGSMGAGGAASDLRRAQRAIEQLRAEVRALQAKIAALEKRVQEIAPNG